MKINNNMRTGVISGVLGSILFFIFFQPAIEYLGSFSSKFISLFFNSYNDSIYITAATKNTNASTNIVLSAIFGLSHGLIISTVIIYFGLITNPQTKQSTANIITNIIRKSIIFKYFLPIFALLFLVYSFATFYNKTASVFLIYEFEQNLAILRPYIGEELIIKLSSEWGLMSSEQDYKVISNKLNEYALQNEIKLPN